MTADAQISKQDAADYLHKDLTEKLIGASFKVYNALGYGFREKEYQSAYAVEISKLNLQFKRELYCLLKYDGKVISKFFIDFLVEDKIVVEFKVAEEFYKKHFDQVMTYLKDNKLELGLLIIFTSKKVLVKRIINQKSA
ncbi:MAG: GxxExxY protein [Patescibacteria group bacterium]